MKTISRIFSAVVCSASLFAYDAVAAVATTSGSNLTSFNPSTAYNNQWSTLSNARYDGTVTAKADFGNCNALIMRCAQPKCANGGCSEMNIAAQIVAGCVKANSKCKQYGDDLIQFMSAELVASSTAKINANNAATAAAQEAAERAQQAQQAQQQQMMQMQNDMQQQMMQMQQQMAEQNARSSQQIAEALAQSQQQNAAAIADMRAAATESAKAQLTTTTVTERDVQAVQSGVDQDTVARVKISGQVMQKIKDAKANLKAVRVAMESAFDYAHCRTNGDDCEGPKRVAKWRELASGFLEPYEAVVDNIDEALTIAQTVGVDVSDIYMMLNNSCNSWGEYLCPRGTVEYDNDKNGKGQQRAPKVCNTKITADMISICEEEAKTFGTNKDIFDRSYAECITRQRMKSDKENCKYCTLLRILPDRDSVYQGWVNSETSTTENQKVIACASAAISDSKLFKRRSKRKAGVDVIDLDILDNWINFREPSSATYSEAYKYCSVKGD